MLRAHRVSYELTYGSIPKTTLTLHDCDNPPCVNPAHLWLGSPGDNMTDKMLKGRASRGESHGLVRLTEPQVRLIKSLIGLIPQRRLASRFGVSQQHISDIHTGKRWKHVAV